MLENITIGVLTKNNENTLERTFASINNKFNVIIVDSGSTDRTEEIAIKFEAKFLFNKFVSYSEQRNFLLKKCETEFLLFLDSDEALTDELIRFLEKEDFSKYEDVSIFNIFRTEFLFEKEIHSGFGRSDYQSRLVRRKNIKYVGEVHESPLDLSNGRQVYFPKSIRIDHYPGRDFNSVMSRLVNYSIIR